jgi:hypothetical protein
VKNQGGGWKVAWALAQRSVLRAEARATLPRRRRDSYIPARPGCR